MQHRRWILMGAGVVLGTGLTAWCQNPAAPAAAAPAPAAAAPAVAAPAAVPAPAVTPPAPPAAPAAPRLTTRPPRGITEANPERMKDMQQLHSLRRDYHQTRRTIAEKQQALRGNAEVSGPIGAIEAQIAALREDIRKLEESKPAVYGKADASLMADYERMTEIEGKIQALEKTLYPSRPRPAPAAPAVPPAAPAAPAAP